MTYLSHDIGDGRSPPVPKAVAVAAGLVVCFVAVPLALCPVGDLYRSYESHSAWLSSVVVTAANLFFVALLAWLAWRALVAIGTGAGRLMERLGLGPR